MTAKYITKICIKQDVEKKIKHRQISDDQQAKYVIPKSETKQQI